MNRLVAPLLLLVALPLFGSAPYLVKDIDSNPSPIGSYPSHFLTLGNLTFFTTTDYYGYPRQLWRTDGTDAGTFALAPGGFQKVIWNGKLWFITSAQEPELWFSDGTVAGTQKVTMPAASPAIRPWLLMPGATHLYFLNSTGTFSNGGTIWQTDGTTETTAQVSSTTFASLVLNDDRRPQSPSAVLGSSTFFTASTGLWRADGSGLTLVKSVAASGEYLSAPFRVGSSIVFYDQTSNTQLWRTDGTAANTAPLKASPPISTQSWINSVISNSYLYFVGDDGSGQKLWKSDGTDAGTVVVATSLPGASTTFNATPLAALPNGTILSLGPSVPPASSMFGLWAFDGTNTTLLSSSVTAGNTSSSGTVAGNNAFFGSGGNLYRSDGTAAGTISLGQVNGSDGTHNWPMGALGSTLLFGGSDSTHGFELWKSDGTAANTAFFKDLLVTTYSSEPNTLRPFKGGVLFTASSDNVDTNTKTRDLWFSDGTEAGTQKLLTNTFIYNITPCGGRAFFANETADAGVELWTTDGTPAGSGMLADLYPGSTGSSPNHSSPGGFVCVDDHVFFLARSSPSTTTELWRSDGTVPGTMMIASFGNGPGDGSAGAGLPVRYGHKILFPARVNYADELWQSDGTPAGTSRVKSFAPNGVNSPIVSGNYAYILQGGNSPTIWRTDGTEAGTVSVVSGSFINALADVDGRLAYYIYRADNTTNDCTTGGTAADIRCFDAGPTTTGGWTFQFKALNGRIYYNVPTLRSSDGTTSQNVGTVRTNTFLATAGGRLYMTGDLADTGYSYLLESDGTQAGTSVLLQSASEATASGGRLFIAAEELYAYDLAVTATSLTPSSVDSAGGTPVTIAGRGFTAPASVTVGSIAAAVTATSETAITFTAPAHDPGTYDITLTLGDGRRMTLETPLAYTCSAPTAVVSANPAPVCPLTPVALQGSGGTRCAWFPPKGLDDASSCTPHATLSTTTTYTLMVFNASGCASTNNPKVTVTVLPPPNATISINGSTSTSLTPNSSATASVPDAGPGATYAWSAAGADLTSDSGQRTVTFQTRCAPNPTLTVTVTSADGCPTTAKVTLFVGTPNRIDAVSPQIVNPGTLVTLTGVGFACADAVMVKTLFPQTLVANVSPFTIVNDTTIRFRYPVTTRPTFVAVSTPTNSWTSSRTMFRPSRFDFNGFTNKSASDIFWRNGQTGETSLWFMDGLTFSGVRSMTVSATDWVPLVSGDFDGDGRADILWMNRLTGETSIWLMNGATVRTAVRSFTVPTDWVPVGSADFDRDGMSDIFWINTTTGQTSIWFMNGTDVLRGVYSLTVPRPWLPVAFGDFDGNGNGDAFWRNPDTGETSIWLMDGENVVTAVRSFTIGDTRWAPVGTGDFNGDGSADIFWRNSGTGETSIWFMHGINFDAIRSHTIDPAWVPMAFGDYDGDSKADAFWYNPTTGETSAWLMSNGFYVSNARLFTVSDTNWRPIVFR